MKVKVKLAFLTDLPEGTKVGDELRFGGSFTIHGISADLIDTSSMGRTQYLPGEIEVDAYANDINLEHP